MNEAPGSRTRRRLISALGIAQILAWGSSYYLPAVLARPIAQDTGWPLSYVVGGLSIGLLVSGLASTFTGRLIQRLGGRPVLIAGALLMASGLCVMAASPSLPIFLAAWVAMGFGMSAGLYDAGFATLGRLYGKAARPAITALTLWGGFASTACWPLSAFLVESFGWRIACLVYAAIQLLISVPVFMTFVPNPPALFPASSHREAVGKASGRPTFVVLAAILTLAAFIASTLSVHLLTILQLRGAEMATAVALGTLIGPSQVVARILEMFFGRNHHPIWIMIASMVLLALGVGLLLTGSPFPAVALVLYGAGNGIHTIARGALPLVLFDPQQYSVMMGQLAPPSLIVQAAAPFIGALLLGAGGDRLILEVLLLASVAGLLLALVLAYQQKSALRTPGART